MRVKTGLLLVAALSMLAFGQDQAKKKPTTLKGVLLEQLRTTHNEKDWFVPANIAVQGLTAEQANYKDGSGNHSVGQLAYHIVYWDKESLIKFKGGTPPKFSGNNDETFDSFDAKQWDSVVKQLDEEMTEWEKAVEAADDAKVAEWASVIAHIGAHRAYHVGQIIYLRKQKGWWNPENGVK